MKSIDISFLNDNQKVAAVHKDGPLLVLAGAGSGKTKTMITRIGYLIAEYDVKPYNILGVTFTNKASKEMRERAIDLIGENGKDVTLSTFHSFCAKLLRKEIRHLGYESSFTIFDTQDVKGLVKNCLIELELDPKQISPVAMLSWISSMKNVLVSPETLSKLISFVYNASSFPELPPYVDDRKAVKALYKIPRNFWGNLLHVYERYQKKLKLSNAVDFDDLIFLTVRVFAEEPTVLGHYQNIYKYIMVDEYQDTNHAQYILTKLLAAKYRNIFVVGDDYQCLHPDTLISTEQGEIPIQEIKSNMKLVVANGHGKKTLSDKIELKSRPFYGKLFKLTTESGQVIRGTANHCMFARKEYMETKMGFTMFGSNKRTEKMFLHTLNKGTVRQEYLHQDEGMQEYERMGFVTEKRFAKLTDNKFLFTPLSQITTGMFLPIETSNGITEDKVVSVEKEDYDGIVYDINVSDYRNYIADGIVVHNSIYGFRNADISNILDFEKDYPEAKMVKLERNYRSTDKIIELANKVISNNRNQRHKKLWTSKTEGKPASYHVCFDTRSEADFVAGKIQEMLAQYDYRDFTILYRVNAQSRAFEEAFVQQGIPYNIIGAVNFYSRMEIRDLLAYLRVLNNPNETLSLERIINTPKRGIGKATVDKANKYAESEGISLWESLQIADKYLKGATLKKVSEFVELIINLKKESETFHVGEIVDIILDDSGYRDYLEKQNTQEAEDRLSNLQEFLNYAWSHQQELLEKGEVPTIEGLLEKISLLQEETDKQDQDNPNFVKLMTIHASKGLEFPVVFMVGMEENLIPYYRSLDTDEDVEEERRLCYVAITRAELELILTRAEERQMYNQVAYNDPSRFLKEMGFTDSNKDEGYKLPW